MEGKSMDMKIMSLAWCDPMKGLSAARGDGREKGNEVKSMEREKDLKNLGGKNVKRQYLIVPIAVPIAVAVILAVLCTFYSVVSADESVEALPENMSDGRWGIEVPPENMPWLAITGRF